MGPLVATATVAAIGNGAAFSKGREFAAWLGLVPKQYSTGGKAKLLGISKRGNAYLRRMFIHGARAVLFRVKYDTGTLGQWVQQLEHGHRAIRSSSRWPTNWRGSPGPYSVSGEDYRMHSASAAA